MGGRGSGHYYHRSGNGRPVMEGFQRVECWKVFRSYRKHGRCFLWSWKRGTEDAGSVAVEVLPKAELAHKQTGQPIPGRGAVVFRYRRTPYGGEPEDVEVIIPLRWSFPNFGGTRPWFLCPRCFRRVGVLALYGNAFLCRRCLGATYEVRNERPSYRFMRRRDKLLSRLGPDGERPKGMHWRTFARICEEADAADYRSWTVGLEEIQGIIGHRLPGT